MKPYSPVAFLVVLAMGNFARFVIYEVRDRPIIAILNLFLTSVIAYLAEKDYQKHYGP